MIVVPEDDAGSSKGHLSAQENWFYGATSQSHSDGSALYSEPPPPYEPPPSDSEGTYPAPLQQVSEVPSVSPHVAQKRKLVRRRFCHFVVICVFLALVFNFIRTTMAEAINMKVRATGLGVLIVDH
ncbi:hypothetical protein B0H19DRAFT_1246113 [Mycena capillaripes]|nr:hypothetical protein B0H19DRAFT_1246113 [Mycena capillaripes]